MKEIDKPDKNMAGPEARPETSENSPAKTRRSGFARGIKRAIFLSFYVVFLVLVVLGALAALEYYAYLQIKASPVGEAYKGRDLDLARQSSQRVAPIFGYEPTPGFAAIRNTRLGNSYEYINDESFKDFEDVPMEKPSDEYRVFVCGGSVVFGRGPVPPSDSVCDYYEVTYRWNIPHIMEQLLNADPAIRKKIDGKTVRVINAGVAGYVYQNNYLRYLAKIRLYQPDLIVSLDGANEVHTVARPLKDWNYFTQGQYYEVITDVMDMGHRGLMNYVALWLKRNTYFFTWLAFRRGEGPGTIREDVGFVASPQDPTPEMLVIRDRNIAQVADVVAMYHKSLETDRIPHVFALQPMFRNSKKKLMPIEQRVGAVTGMEKIGFYNAPQTYDLLVEQVKKRCREIDFEVVDLTPIFDNVSEWVFTDWCHLTNGGNYIIAKELVNQVKTRVFGLSPDADDLLKNPYDSYFRDYAKNATVLINGQREDKGLSILKGYPSESELLAVAPGAGNAPSDIVLDIGSIEPVSRIRIVWGDKTAVPDQWRIELSDDGSNWKTWFAVEKCIADEYDQWPGFEHYSHDELPARYVRYVPMGTHVKDAVKLRQISLFR